MMELAIKIARTNPIKRRGRSSAQRMAAVLSNGKDIYTGMNSWKTHPMQARFSRHPDCIHIHAEIAAIVAAVRAGQRDLSGFSLWVARVLRDGHTALAAPCTGCQRAIGAFDIANVYWTA